MRIIVMLRRIRLCLKTVVESLRDSKKTALGETGRRLKSAFETKPSTRTNRVALTRGRALTGRSYEGILANGEPMGTAETDQIFAPAGEQVPSLVLIRKNSDGVDLVADVVTHQTEKLAILGIALG